MISPSKSLARNASAAFAAARPPPTMTKLDVSVIPSAYSPPAGRSHAEERPQRPRVLPRVAVTVVVEIDQNIAALALPVGDQVGPPSQIVLGIRTGVQRFAVGPVHADVHDIGRRSRFARQGGAAHHDVRRAVPLEQRI